MTTVLVTGASGFVGRAVCARLRAAGFHVLAATRLGRPVPEGCEPRPAPDLAPDADWRAALAGADFVVHAAARVHNMKERPDEARAAHHRANFEGALSLARQALEAGTRRLVFISTAKVLGEESPPGRAFSDDSPANPQDPYARSKRQAEEGLLRLPGLETAILRPPLVYGPGAKGNLHALMSLIYKGIPLPLGLVRNRRSLIGLDNLADGALCLLTHPAAPGNTFLIKDITLSSGALAGKLGQALGRPARLLPLPPALIAGGARLLGKRAMADRLLGSFEIGATRLETALGWRPQSGSQDEFARMAAAFRQGL